MRLLWPGVKSGVDDGVEMGEYAVRLTRTNRMSSTKSKPSTEPSLPLHSCGVNFGGSVEGFVLH